MKTISYNLRKNRAVSEVAGISKKYDADIVCLQEAETLVLPNEVEHLKLVHATERNRLGLAVYVRSDRFAVRDARAYSLKKSMHDRLLRPAHERLLGVRLLDRETGRDVVVGSFHAAPLTALNSLRRNQIHAAHGELRELGPGLPSLMVGDFNYPVFQGRLGSEMRESGYDLTISDKRTYTRYKMFRGHFDFATSSGFDITRVRTLKRGTSDHLPILVRTNFEERALQQTLAA